MVTEKSSPSILMENPSVNNLFSLHKVEEIRELERKTRHEIETKKEDLRQMVGERYRDLIEAADTIAEMKICATEVRGSVESLQQFTRKELKAGKFVHACSNSRSEMTSVNRYMRLSAQVKLLMEMSETIWSRVESGSMIDATHLYMQSRQVLKNLNLDGSTTYSPILQWFPVLGQQAQALDNLRATILSECRRQLKDSNLNSKPLSEALCSIILLEGIDASKSFPEFMEARLEAIKSIFKGTSGSSTQLSGSGKLCKVVTLLAATIKQTHKLFVAPIQVSEKSDTSSGTRRKSMLAKGPMFQMGLVSDVLKESYSSFAKTCTDYERSGSIEKERLWCKYLPDSVSKLTSLKTENKETKLSKESVQTLCLKWLENCKTCICEGTSELLSFVTTFKELSTLRHSLWETLKEVSDNNNSKESHKSVFESGDSVDGEWEESCMSVIGQHLLIWDQILKNLFLEKVKSICKSSLTNVLGSGEQHLNRALTELRKSGQGHDSEVTSKFIWNERPNDILNDTAWKQVSLRKIREIKGGLGLKALTVTPLLYNTCFQLNTSMKLVTADLVNYIPSIKKDASQSYPLKKKNVEKIVDQEEITAICEHFHKACEECLHKLVSLLKGFQSKLSEQLPKDQNRTEEVLFLAMFCRNFCDLCHEFQFGVTVGNGDSSGVLKKQLSNPGSSMTSSMLSHSFHQSSASPAWEEISTTMTSQGRCFLKLWSEAMIQKDIDNFSNSILNTDCAADLFKTMPTWDNVAIEEESESGSKIDTEIKLPMAVSWPVLELLYSLCDSISQVGGHSMSRSTLQDITATTLRGVLHTYVRLRNKITEGPSSFSPSQTWALQNLFNIRMLYSLLHCTSVVTTASENAPVLYDVKEDSFSELVDWLESYIDPFDLDVFSPHLTKNINRFVQSTSVMLGFVTPPDKSESLHAHSLSKSAGNSHNILPLSSDCGRFSYLPISSRTSKSDVVSMPSSIKNHLPLSSALQQLTAAENKKLAGQGKLASSLYSKLGALSSSWLSMTTSEN